MDRNRIEITRQWSLRLRGLGRNGRFTYIAKEGSVSMVLGLVVDWIEMSKHNFSKYLQVSYSIKAPGIFLPFPPTGKYNSEIFTTFPKTRNFTHLDSPANLQQRLSLFFTFLLLGMSGSLYLILSPDTAFIHLQVYCLHPCMQMDHLWKMPWNGNFIWTGVIAKSASIFFVI